MVTFGMVLQSMLIKEPFPNIYQGPLMPEFNSLPEMITECFERDDSREKQWYERYRATFSKVKSQPESADVLELLWYTRDNAVASLMQGNTSKSEFETAKLELANLTRKIVASPTKEVYEESVNALRQLKQNRVFKSFYGALLNRVFAAIAPDKVTSCVKEEAFLRAAEHINSQFNLGLTFQGSWFEKNIALKHALKERLSDKFDDFKINIAIWNVYELLEEEKKATSKLDNPSTQSANVFIFQGNPVRFDVDDYLINNHDILWTANRYAKDMTIGDLAYIWRSGEHAGVIALGKITELPASLSELEESGKLRSEDIVGNDEDRNTKKVGIKIGEYRLSENEGMVERQLVKDDPILGSSLIIKNPQSSVFKLSNVESSRMKTLWEGANDINDNVIQEELEIQSIEPLNLSVEQYKEVLQAKAATGETGLMTLSTLYHMPNSKATSKELARVLGYERYSGANSALGQVSKRIAQYFGIEKEDIRNKYQGWWQLVANGERLSEGFTWQLKENLKKALEELNLTQLANQLAVNESPSTSSHQRSLNQIFYGPPGTGKTFHTIEAAVRAAEPHYAWSTRTQLKVKYDELVSQKRIQFVTFHQSYGYEEFVEGLRAVTEDGQVSYEVQAGIFKRVCTSAANNMVKSQRIAYERFETCWDAFLEEFDDEHGIKILTKKAWFRVTEVTDNTIHFEKASGTSKHTLAIKTLKAIFNGTKVIKGGLNVYYQPLVKHLKSYAAKESGAKESPKNFVLIIDEINRGNISKVFGELITLIEDSKRSFNGTTESIEVTLPYSGDPFSVPANLYLIGTMNTADRSLAMMDTALRRRFDFVEMMPNYSLLEGQVVNSIKLDMLLRKMNARIEALYDREHTLGHAFLIPVVEGIQTGDEVKAFGLLKQIFLNKVVPLLEEYFFDDWNKIRLVLGDNQKPDELQFVKVLSTGFDELFGLNHELDSFMSQNETFELASSSDRVWDDELAYKTIYNPIAE